MASIGGPNIVESGLVLSLDAANTKSYSSGSTTWNDLSGNSSNGTLVNGPTFNSSNGGSIIFDGVNDYVNCGNNVNLNPTEQITIECNFKLLQIEPLVYPNLVIKSNSAGSFGLNQYGLWLWRGGLSNRGIGFRLAIDTFENTTISSTGVDVNDLLNKYTSITGTYNGTHMRIYLNTILVGELPITGNIRTVSDPLVIGRNGSSSNNYFNGNIYNTKIYNRALTQEEVLQNYNATKGRFGL